MKELEIIGNLRHELAVKTNYINYIEEQLSKYRTSKVDEKIINDLEAVYQKSGG